MAARKLTEGKAMPSVDAPRHDIVEIYLPGALFNCKYWANSAKWKGKKGGSAKLFSFATQ